MPETTAPEVVAGLPVVVPVVVLITTGVVDLVVVVTPEEVRVELYLKLVFV